MAIDEDSQFQQFLARYKCIKDKEVHFNLRNACYSAERDMTETHLVGGLTPEEKLADGPMSPERSLPAKFFTTGYPFDI
ncbi:hypothetical protein LXL04_020013 [Taraxacum kok-saghyz]